MARWDGEVVGVVRSTDLPELVLSHLRPAGEPVEAGARNHLYIEFERIIDIQSTEKE